MINQIIFRGKCLKTHKWVYGSLIDTVLGGGRAWIIKFSCIYGRNNQFMRTENIEVIPKTIGVFTGYKDKNGVDIYTGDRLKHKWSADWDTGGGEEIIVVKLDKKWGYFSFNCLSGLSGSVERIGDIFEVNKI